MLADERGAVIESIVSRYEIWFFVGLLCAEALCVVSLVLYSSDSFFAFGVDSFHRLVESRQRQVRIVALSATLPNYADVAEFLQVPERGLFFFGPEHRPVPLRQQFIGVVAKTRDRNLKEQKLNDICYEEVVDALKGGHQVMVFVHSRKGTFENVACIP